MVKENPASIDIHDENSTQGYFSLFALEKTNNSQQEIVRRKKKKREENRADGVTFHFHQSDQRRGFKTFLTGH